MPLKHVISVYINLQINQPSMLIQLGEFLKNALYVYKYFVANNILCQSSELFNNMSDWKNKNWFKLVILKSINLYFFFEVDKYLWSA